VVDVPTERCACGEFVIGRHGKYWTHRMDACTEGYD
jgi:hypothetical protein